MDNSIRQVTKWEGIKMPIDSGEEWRNMPRADQEEALRKITESLGYTSARVAVIEDERETITETPDRFSIDQ